MTTTPEKHGKRPCPRCGFERIARTKFDLCSDCRSVLTKEERRAWAAPGRKRGPKPRVVVETTPSPVTSLLQLGSGRSFA